MEKRIYSTLYSIAISIFLLSLLASCMNEDQANCQDDNVPYLETFYSDEFATIPCALQNIDSNEKDVNLIIANPAELERYFTCYKQLSGIDFEKYFVLAGRHTHHQCAMFESQQVFTCANRITYSVKMLERDCHAVTSVFYATAIERKYYDLPVDFDVQVKD